MAMTPIDARMHQPKFRRVYTTVIFHKEGWTYRRRVDETKRVVVGCMVAALKARDRAVLRIMSRPEMLIAYCAYLRFRAIAALFWARLKKSRRPSRIGGVASEGVEQSRSQGFADVGL